MSDLGNKIRVWKYVESEDGGKVIEILHNEFTTLDETSLYLPKGAYTTFRTYHGDKVLRLKDHFKRLKESTKRTCGVDEDNIHHLMRVAINATQYEESRIRITIPNEETATMFIAIEPLHVLSTDNYSKGVRVITTNQLHRANPRAKLTNFIDQSKGLRNAIPAGINETLMINEAGYILEGLSSNFFTVLNDEVRTADDGVLQGITRNLVIETIHQMGIRIVCTPIQASDIPNISEAFITSTSRGVLPVIQIDDTIIGSGVPGSITQRLSLAYSEKIGQELDSI